MEMDTGQRGTDRGWGTQAHQWTLTQEAWHGSDSFTLRSGQAQIDGLTGHELRPASPCQLLPEAWWLFWGTVVRMHPTGSMVGAVAPPKPCR